MTIQLSVEVGEQTSLQQRIFRKINATNHVSNLEHDLLSLGKVVSRITVQCELSKRRERNNVLGNYLGRIENVKAPTQLVVFLENLSLEDPLREVPLLNIFEQILTVEIGVHACSNLSFLPQEGRFALQCPEPKLDELCFALIGNKSESVHTPSIRVSE